MWLIGERERTYKISDCRLVIELNKSLKYRIRELAKKSTVTEKMAQLFMHKTNIVTNSPGSLVTKLS